MVASIHDPLLPASQPPEEGHLTVCLPHRKMVAARMYRLYEAKAVVGVLREFFGTPCEAEWRANFVDPPVVV